MKNAGNALMCRLGKILAVCFALLFIFNGLCFAAGGKPWEKEDTYKVMNFAVLAVGLYIVFRKYGSGFLDGRINGIRNQLRDLEEQKKQAEVELAKYQEKLLDLSKESAKIIDEYMKQGEEARSRILKEAENSAIKIEEQAKRNIEYEFIQAKQKLQEEVIEKAIAKAEQIIRESISGEDQERIIDEYLKKVVA